MERILLRPSEVAEALGVGRTTAYQLIRSGLLPTIRVGTSVRVPAEALRRWVTEAAEQGIAGRVATGA